MWLIALITVIGFLMYLGKLEGGLLRKVLHFELQLDLFIDLVLVYLFSGTLGGMMIGAIAGLGFNLALFIIKRVHGHDELRRVTCDGCGRSHLKWVPHRGAGWLFWMPQFARSFLARVWDVFQRRAHPAH